MSQTPPPPVSASNPSAPARPVNVPSRPDGTATAVEIARHLSDDKCADIMLLDVRGISQVQDYVILATGSSDRQMRSAASGIKSLLASKGSSVYRTSVDEQSTWIVIDCVDTVVHLFEPNTRSYYDLESMWGDAPKIEWLRPGQRPFVMGDQELSEPAATADAATEEDEEEGEELDLSRVSLMEIVTEVTPEPARSAKKTTGKAAKTTAKKPAARAKGVKPVAKKSKSKATAPSKAVKKPVAKKPPAKKAPVKKADKPAAKAAKKVAKKASKKKR